MRGVEMRPGAMPMMRIGAISEASDLIRPLRPGRIRLDVVIPATGSRAELDRMIPIAARSLWRRWGSAARMRRTALWSVPSMARCQVSSSRSAKRPSGGPPLLTSITSRPPKASTAADTAAAGPSGVARSTGTAVAAIWSAARSSRSEALAATATRAPSARSAAATAAPSPELPPPTSARAPSSPRSISRRLAAQSGDPTRRLEDPTGDAG
jgi:hypothetical protein